MDITNQKIGMVYWQPVKYNSDRKLSDIVKLCYHHTACCQYYDTVYELDKAIDIINRDHSVRLHTSTNGYGNHVAYHAVIGINGEIIHTRPLDQFWRHCANLDVNKHSVWLVYVGNGNIQAPTDKQYKSMAEYIRWIRSQVGHVALYPHFSMKATACPGRLFDHKKLYNYVKDSDHYDPNNPSRF